MPDDIHERVLQAFQQEHREHTVAMREHMQQWPQLSRDTLEEVFRLAHSLKGGARVCDLPVVESLTHHAEQVLATLLRGERQPEPEMRRTLEEILASVEDYMVAIAQGEVPEAPAALFGKLGLPLPRQAAAPAPASRPKAPELLRLRAEHLDRLLRTSGQVLAEATRQGHRGGELRAMLHTLQSLIRQCDTFGDEPRFSEIRSQLNQASRVARQMLASQQESARSLRLLGEQLQTDARQARMVPVGSVFEGFDRMVREAAREQNKAVEYSAQGMDLEADRVVLQALKDPVMHALRNAVTHGTPSRDGIGRVSLTASITGGRLRVQVGDNGPGLALEKIRRRAVELGIASEEEAAGWLDFEAASMVFRPGFSTQQQVTAFAGRGIGLSVVREAASRLQGIARIGNAPGGGTALEIDVPVSAATHRLLIVHGSEIACAVPVTTVRRLHRLPASAIESAEGKARVWLENEAVLLTSLSSALGKSDASVATKGGMLSVVLLQAGGAKLALGVDCFGREVDTFVSALPAPASASPYFSGGAVLEDGATVLVLDVPAVIERCKGGRLEGRAEPLLAPEAKRKPRILVVDDSFTARTLQKNILESAGFEARVAVDGAQGLATVRAGSFDAVVADVQMPRMDGFQLLEAMKQDDRLKDVPVVLVTSLNSEEDQARGLSLGAAAYIVKQRFDHGELLETIRQLI